MPPPPPLPTMSAMAMPYGELQQATVYAGMARTLRGIGIGHIFSGCILLVLGAIFAFVTHIDADQALIAPLALMAIFGLFGIAFIAEGIWLIAAPSASGLLVAAISIIVSAVLFMKGILVLIILVAYGVMLIQRYKKYGPMMAHRPSPAMLTKANEVLDKLTKTKRVKSPDLIEFSASDALARRLWRGLLQDDMVILIALEARLFRKGISEVYFLPSG